MAKTFSFGTSGWTEEEVKALDEMAKETDRSKFLRGLVRKEVALRTPPPTPPQKKRTFGEGRKAKVKR